MAQDIEPPSEGNEESKALRHQLEQTRTALAVKLDALQKRMTQSVETACDTVDETVNSAKLTALDAVLSIKHLLNLKQQFARHPWTAMGIATCVGAVLAQRRNGPNSFARHRSELGPRSGETSIASESGETAAAQVDTRPQQANMKQWLNSRVQTELMKLQGAAIGAGVNLLCGLINRLMPRSGNEPQDK